MLSKILINLPLFVALVACKDLPPNQHPGQTSYATIQSSGVTRTYNISIPPNYDGKTPTPLMFSFHGGGSNPGLQEILSQMSNPVFNNFAITAYPAGVNATWNLGIPNPKPGDRLSTANDLQFVTDMISSFENLYVINSSQIWAAGKSDGGGFCNVLACDSKLSTKIAAFAPVSGAFYVDGPTGSTCNPPTVPFNCTPGRAQIPVVEFHGLHDPVIMYGGSSTRYNSCLPTIPHWTQAWAARDGLMTTNVTSNLTSDTLKYTFGTGSETGLVTQYTDFNASFGHDWPFTNLTIVREGGDQDAASFNATPIIIDFFKKNPLP